MAEGAVAAQACSLDDPKVRGVLDRLHADASGQRLALLGLLGSMVADRVLRRSPSVQEEAARLKNLYVCLSPKQGSFAYQSARVARARRIVEFGTSFGVSTIYLACAVRDNGGGVVIGSEFQPEKLVRARANIAEAGLSQYVEIRAGDAQETLRDPGGAVDLVLLDGLKELYLPMLKLLTPHLHQGSVVIADNIFTFRQALAPFVAYLRDPANGFRSLTLVLGDGMEYAVRL